MSCSIDTGSFEREGEGVEVEVEGVEVGVEVVEEVVEEASGGVEVVVEVVEVEEGGVVGEEDEDGVEPLSAWRIFSAAFLSMPMSSKVLTAFNSNACENSTFGPGRVIGVCLKPSSFSTSVKIE
jgi:hypothetical protein